MRAPRQTQACSPACAEPANDHLLFSNSVPKRSWRLKRNSPPTRDMMHPSADASTSHGAGLWLRSKFHERCKPAVNVQKLNESLLMARMLTRSICQPWQSCRKPPPVCYHLLPFIPFGAAKGITSRSLSDPTRSSHSQEYALRRRHICCA